MTFSEVVINHNYPGFNPVQFGHESCLPGHSYGPAVRNFWLLHYVVTGTGIFFREGKSYSVNPGEVFVIPPFVETFYKADKKNPWQYIWIGFQADGPITRIFDKAIINTPGLGGIFKDMRNIEHMDGGRSAFLSGKIWELVSLLLETSQDQPDNIEKAVHYINSEYMNSLSVSGLAKRFNLDRCYFSTLFTEKIGIPPSKYIIQLRLNKAAELMRVYREPPSVAAASVGYTDIYNFSKSFKKKFGCSPRQYISEYSKEMQS